MNILILQGPNLNLLGIKSSETKERLTLDKLNKALRKHVHQKGVDLKFLQTHKQFQAINFLQRNRTWADGLILIPTSWARYDWSLVETMNLIKLPTAAIYFETPYLFESTQSDSILKSEFIKPFTGQPIESCIAALDHLLT